MSLLSTPMLQQLSQTGAPGTWPRCLSEDEELRLQVEVMLRSQPEDVRAALLDRLSDADPRGPLWVRTALQAIGVALQQGCRVQGLVVPGLFRMSCGSTSFVLAPIAFRLPDLDSRDEDVAALRSALDGALRSRYYTLRLKKPLPPKFNPTPVATAAQIWAQSVARGDDVSRCAAYEDKAIGVEICLTPDDALPGGQGGCVMVVRPTRSLEVLSQLDARLMYVVTLAGEAAPGLPIIGALGCGGEWGLPRGFVNQILFGSPLEVLAHRDGDQTKQQSLFLANGLSLFSDPLSMALAGLWWCDVEGGGLDTSASYAQNPWSTIGRSLPPFDGRAFECVEGPTGERGEVIMAWNALPPRRWSPS